MNKQTLEKIKKELLARRKEITSELGQITEDGDYKTKFPSVGDNPEDNVLEIDEYTTNLATEKVFESSLRDIDGALDRIEKGTYGTCKYCKKEIGEGRLLARPVANSCIECKSKLQNS